jgi:hypothetical protein
VAFAGDPDTAAGIGFKGKVGSGDTLVEDELPDFDGSLSLEDAAEGIDVGETVEVS